MKAPSESPEGATLESTVREKIRNDLLAGALAPNEKLRIRALAERYNVGATPVREALSKLVAEGLVSIENNRGFKAAPLSFQELSELTEMRQILEIEAFRRSMRRGDDVWESQIVAKFHRLSRFLEGEQPDPTTYRLTWEARHREFHIALIEYCGNGKLMYAADQLYQHMARYRSILQVNELPAPELIRIHKELMDCALERDEKRGVEVMMDHFSVNIDQLKSNLKLYPDLFATLGQE